MKNKTLNRIRHDKLIEKVNILGPWVHGYFDLGNGLIIEDQDRIQQKRLFLYRNYYIDIISKLYRSSNLREKTFCEVGCNAGYFLFELYKKFNFKKAIGLEPRESNLAKAKFIAEYFNLPKNIYILRQFDILTRSNILPAYDIVIMASVLHHIDNHLHALRNLYKMTNELCIIDTHVLPSEVNTKVVADSLELKDDVYKRRENVFGVSGYKLETNYLDGSTFYTGIVGLPTTESLVMMLNHVGFSKVTIYRSCKQLKKEVYNDKRYHRDMNCVLVIAQKGFEKKESESYDEILRDIQKEEFNTIVPMDIISGLYRCINRNLSKDKLPDLARLIYKSIVDFNNNDGQDAIKNIEKKIGCQKYYSIIVKTFRHAPVHKIGFEYAKTCYHEGYIDEAEEVLKKLIRIINLDWRTVYKSYYLLALINFNKGEKRKALKYNRLSLRAFDSYFLARELNEKLHNISCWR